MRKAIQILVAVLVIELYTFLHSGHTPYLDLKMNTDYIVELLTGANWHWYLGFPSLALTTLFVMGCIIDIVQKEDWEVLDA